MLHFALEFNTVGEISEFELGDMTVTGENGIITSRGNSRLSMMLFISIPLLLYGVQQLVLIEKNRTYEFNGIDGSFIFEIHKQGQNQFALIDRQRTIAVVSKEELVQAVWRDVNHFYERYRASLKPDGVEITGINLAFGKFYKAFEKILNS